MLYRNTDTHIIKVWTFTFCGSGKTKYTNQLLELACNFEYEFSDQLKTAILNNWLCNLTGQDGHWFPLDLLLEHNINLLKAMTPQRDAPFANKLFSQTISLNIRYFLAVKESMRSSLRLGQKGGSHSSKRKIKTMDKLITTMHEHELHRFRKGRTYGFKAQDDFAEGYTRYDTTSRISDFISRTLSADDSVHKGYSSTYTGAPQSASLADGVGDTQPISPAGQDEFTTGLPVPSIWEDGELVLGDEYDGSVSDDSDCEN